MFEAGARAVVTLCGAGAAGALNRLFTKMILEFTGWGQRFLYQELVQQAFSAELSKHKVVVGIFDTFVWWGAGE